MTDDETATSADPEDTDENSQSKKTEVVQILFDQLCPLGALGSDRVIASSRDVISAIRLRNTKHPKEDELSDRNVANFLKDFIRKPTSNVNWPVSLKARRVTARQVYGKEQVFEFVPYGAGDVLPFPDRYEPTDDMPKLPFETLSIPIEARALGRKDEPWLIQVTVNQRIVHAHLAIHAAAAGLQVETLAHLQTSVKTQPEIDATFIATIRAASGDQLRTYVTVEAKQLGERLLEHQIREQVARAFVFTSKLQGTEAIHAVLPMALKVIDHHGERGIYVVQFFPLLRTDYDAKYGTPELLPEMPLDLQSRSFFAPHPHVSGISARVSKPKSKPKRP